MHSCKFLVFDNGSLVTEFFVDLSFVPTIGMHFIFGELSGLAANRVVVSKVTYISIGRTFLITTNL